jgi:hypothetical protein
MNYFYSGWVRNGNLVSAVKRPGPNRANHGYYSCYWEAWDITGAAETAKSSASSCGARPVLTARPRGGNSRNESPRGIRVMRQSLGVNHATVIKIDCYPASPAGRAPVN